MSAEIQRTKKKFSHVKKKIRKYQGPENASLVYDSGIGVTKREGKARSCRVPSFIRSVFLMRYD